MEYNVLILTFFVSIMTACVFAGGELNDPCILVQECRHFGYYCGRNKTCQCLSPSYVRNKQGDKCVGIINSKCKYDEHCIEGAYCREQTKCKCKYDLVPTSDLTECSHSDRAIPKPYLLLPVLIIVRLCLW